MTSPQVIGQQWESKVVEYLQSRGLTDAYRLRGLEGPKDHGDIGGFHRWALDCKDQTRMSLGAWVAQAKDEAHNSHKPLSAVIVKRRDQRPEDALVVMDLHTWTLLERYIQDLSRDKTNEAYL